MKSFFDHKFWLIGLAIAFICIFIVISEFFIWSSNVDDSRREAEILVAREYPDLDQKLSNFALCKRPTHHQCDAALIAQTTDPVLQQRVKNALKRRDELIITPAPNFGARIVLWFIWHLTNNQQRAEAQGKVPSSRHTRPKHRPGQINRKENMAQATKLIKGK